MSSGSSNPYDSPGVVPEAKKTYSTGTRRFDYAAMCGFAFSSPNWFVNLLFGGLCFFASHFIPVLPQLIFMGYLWTVFDDLHVRKWSTYGDFDFNRFSDYLSRAIWPFLAAMVAMLVMMVVIFPMMFVMGFGASMMESRDYQVLGAIVFGSSMIVFLVLSVAINLIMVPITLRAGISQELGQAFNIAWIKEFISLTWLEILLGGLALLAFGVLAEMLGCMLFCVGLWPAIAAIMYSHMHYQWQLYEIFLDRGGSPVPVKQKAFVPPAASVPPPQY